MFLVRIFKILTMLSRVPVSATVTVLHKTPQLPNLQKLELEDYSKT